MNRTRNCCRIAAYAIAAVLLGCGGLEKFQQPVANFAKAIEALTVEVRSETSQANLANQEYRYGRLTTRPGFIVEADNPEKPDLLLKSDQKSRDSLKVKSYVVPVKGELAIANAMESLKSFADILTQLAGSPAEDKVFASQLTRISGLFSDSGAALESVGSEVTDSVLRADLNSAAGKIKALSKVAGDVARIILEGERAKAISQGLNDGLPQVEGMMVDFDSILKQLRTLEEAKLTAHHQMLTELLTSESLLGSWSFSDEQLMKTEILRLNRRLARVDQLKDAHHKLIGDVVAAIAALREAAGMKPISNEKLKDFVKKAS